MLRVEGNTNILPQIAENTRLIPEMVGNAKSDSKILEEIKGLSEDMRPGFSIKIRQMQVDIWP